MNFVSFSFWPVPGVLTLQPVPVRLVTREAWFRGKMSAQALMAIAPGWILRLTGELQSQSWKESCPMVAMSSYVQPSYALRLKAIDCFGAALQYHLSESALQLRFRHRNFRPRFFSFPKWKGPQWAMRTLFLEYILAYICAMYQVMFGGSVATSGGGWRAPCKGLALGICGYS